MPAKSDQKPIFHVADNDAGQRLDNYLIKHCKQLVKSSCYKLIRKGQIRVNGKRSKPLQKLLAGDQVRVPAFVFFVDQITTVVPAAVQQKLRQSFIHEDADYLVLNKPAGLPVHTGTGHEYGVIEIINAMDGLAEAQLAHRLDKDTSGCLLLAKNRTALLHFQEMMKNHEVTKSYLAILQGQLVDPVTVTQALDTDHRVDGLRYVVVSQEGRSAETSFNPIKSHSNMTLTRCDIQSGRTHQIRVHAQYLGLPVLGDRLYGKKRPETGRELFLHAHLLSFGLHSFVAPMPVEFEQVLTEN